MRAVTGGRVRRAAGVGILMAACVAGPAGAQHADPSRDGSTTNTIVARYEVDPGAFAAVGSVEQLVRTLRDALNLVAAMPLRDELQVSLGGAVVDPDGGGTYPFLSSDLGVSISSGADASASVAYLTEWSHTDGGREASGEGWDEDAAWGWLAEAIRTGLTESLAASGRFAADEEGRVPLTVVEVHSVEDGESLEGRFARQYIRLRPEPQFSLSARADWEPPEGFGYDVRGIVLELEPGSPAAVEISPETWARVAGTYDSGGGIKATFREEGDGFVAVMAGMGREQVIPLTPVSETRFLGDTGDEIVEFTFAMGADGAESVTLTSAGFEMGTWPRENPFH